MAQWAFMNHSGRIKPQTIFATIGIAAIAMLCLGMFGRSVIPWSQALYSAGWMSLALFVYSLPSMIAVTRRHRNRKAVLILNLVLGWTVLGWIGALVWAYWNEGPKEKPGRA
jgi:hypothetical protein